MYEVRTAPPEKVRESGARAPGGAFSGLEDGSAEFVAGIETADGLIAGVGVVTLATGDLFKVGVRQFGSFRDAVRQTEEDGVSGFLHNLHVQTIWKAVVELGFDNLFRVFQERLPVSGMLGGVVDHDFFDFSAGECFGHMFGALAGGCVVVGCVVVVKQIAWPRFSGTGEGNAYGMPRFFSILQPIQIQVLINGNIFRWFLNVI